MSALKGEKRFNNTSYAERDAHGVLPRPLRKSVRFISALCNGRVAIPRHAGVVSMFALFALTGVYGMALGGHTHNVAEAATSAIGFSINNVKVSGNAQTSEVDILQQLGLDGSSSVVSLSVAKARKKLIALPWVEDAEVRKVYPNTVEIDLTERKAFGIWQHDNSLDLIEADGKVITQLRDNKFTSLPLFVGDNAEDVASEFKQQMSNWPAIQKRVRAYIYVGERRWDLLLDNGVTVRLPEENIARAMHVLSTMEADEQLLERDIKTVDLRLSDRTAIQLTEDAAKRREKAVAERAKILKKAEKNI